MSGALKGGVEASGEAVAQPEINIGTLGHVDNGKSTLVQALTGVWTSKHSEEIRRGITIRIGYADAVFYRCKSHDSPLCYTSERTCPVCGGEAEPLRMVSFVDCPGHHSLMVTMLSGAALMDGALFVVAADAPCPQAQDREHMVAAKMAGIRKMVLVQNKIDIVDRERALKNFEEITLFLKEMGIEGVPIIPVSAQHRLNIDALIGAIEENIPTPKRDLAADPRLYVLRSFDVNKPGSTVDELVGGVIGGSIARGVFRVGDEIEIRPGVKKTVGGKSVYEPLLTEVRSLRVSKGWVREAKPGGLVGIGTALDPSLAKSDGLVGNIVGRAGTLPPTVDQLTLDVRLFEKAFGTEEQVKVQKIKTNEALVLNIVTSVTSGIVTSAREDVIAVSLKKPVCVEKGANVAISRRIREGWRLIGYGTLK
ncbi:MAG: translation initiation factor IF-2 subunit gamma [Candidatus Bathyarchaeia archaeon]